MIGILLNDSAYEQDIRELLMAFYPGQTFAHEMQEDLDFFVEGTVNEDRTEFTLCLDISEAPAPSAVHGETGAGDPGLNFRRRRTVF